MSEYQHDKIRDHEYDGIQEFDNKLPNWWLWILYGSIVFAIGYWLVLHTLSMADLSFEQFDKEQLAAAEAQLARMGEGGPTDESLNLMATLPDKVDQGRTLFLTHCMVCHNDRGQGNVGPNLTDAYWIHGGRPTDILRTVTEGVLSKGMAAWGRQLGPTRVQLVTSYVLTLRDTQVPGKDPEGELYKPEPVAEPEQSR